MDMEFVTSQPQITEGAMGRFLHSRSAVLMATLALAGAGEMAAVTAASADTNPNYFLSFGVENQQDANGNDVVDVSNEGNACLTVDLSVGGNTYSETVAPGDGNNSLTLSPSLEGSTAVLTTYDCNDTAQTDPLATADSFTFVKGYGYSASGVDNFSGSSESSSGSSSGGGNSSETSTPVTTSSTTVTVTTSTSETVTTVVTKPPVKECVVPKVRKPETIKQAAASLVKAECKLDKQGLVLPEITRLQELKHLAWKVVGFGEKVNSHEIEALKSGKTLPRGSKLIPLLHLAKR